MTQPATIVLGLSPTGLHVARQAAASGSIVYGFSDQRECGASSRYLARRGKTTVVSMEALETVIQELAEIHSHLGIIPSTDRHVERLADLVQRLPATVRVAGAYRTGAARIGLDKAQINSIASRVGIAVPNEFALDQVKGEGGLRFPLILKPKAIHKQRHWLRGRKLFVCRNRRDFDQVVGQPEFIAADWTAQALIHGPESNIQVAAVFRSETGVCDPIYTARKLRQYPANFGSASLLVSEPDAEVASASVQLLEVMEFQGIAGVEFKRDARDGRLYLIEMNPRPSLWFGAASAQGMCTVSAQLKEWFDSDVSVDETTDRRTVLWRYGVKDMASQLSHWQMRKHPVLPAPVISVPSQTRRDWAVFRPLDPLPAVAELMAYVRKAWSRLAH